MTEEIKQRMIENIKNNIDIQASACLELDVNGNIGETIYNEQDLMNVSLVFNHILGNISAGHCLNQLGLDINQASMIAEESGKNIRQTILLATGLDTKILAKNK